MKTVFKSLARHLPNFSRPTQTQIVVPLPRFLGLGGEVDLRLMDFLSVLSAEEAWVHNVFLTLSSLET